MDKTSNNVIIYEYKNHSLHKRNTAGLKVAAKDQWLKQPDSGIEYSDVQFPI